MKTYLFMYILWCLGSHLTIAGLLCYTWLLALTEFHSKKSLQSNRLGSPHRNSMGGSTRMCSWCGNIMIIFGFGTEEHTTFHFILNNVAARMIGPPVRYWYKARCMHTLCLSMSAVATAKKRMCRCPKRIYAVRHCIVVKWSLILYGFLNLVFSTAFLSMSTWKPVTDRQMHVNRVHILYVYNVPYNRIMAMCSHQTPFVWPYCYESALVSNIATVSFHKHPNALLDWVRL